MREVVNGIFNFLLSLNRATSSHSIHTQQKINPKARGFTQNQKLHGSSHSARSFLLLSARARKIYLICRKSPWKRSQENYCRKVSFFDDSRGGINWAWQMLWPRCFSTLGSHVVFTFRFISIIIILRVISGAEKWLARRFFSSSSLSRTIPVNLASPLLSCTTETGLSWVLIPPASLFSRRFINTPAWLENEGGSRWRRLEDLNRLLQHETFSYSTKIW